MRLIDADELMELYDGLKDKGLVIPVDVVIQNIKDMPTAYDPDKVAEQLVEKSFIFKNGSVCIQTLDAIKIVKGGAV